MNVLIISHNVLGGSSGMGKTLKTYFSGIPEWRISQFYIHSEVPTDQDVCVSYYRFTDMDAVRSFIPFYTAGTVFNKNDIEPDRSFSRTDRGLLGDVYQYGRRRTPAIYLARNAVWRRRGWKSERFRMWIDEISPDIVFLAAGDYAFIYDVALYAAEYAGCALVVLCTDDYYLEYDQSQAEDSTDKKSLPELVAGRQLLKTARKTMRRSECILCMCDEMRDRYRELFRRPAVTVYTGAPGRKQKSQKPMDCMVSYVGYLGGNRYRSLIELGNAIADLEMENGPYAIDVYSNEKRVDVLKRLKEARGIRFHGEADQETAENVIADSTYVVHVEGFDSESRKGVRYSISTKIADYLMNGPCIIAYGPEEAASMKYLSENGAGFVITEQNRLTEDLKKLFSENDHGDRIEKARRLARKNHDPAVVRQRTEKIMKQAIRRYQNRQKEGRDVF